jgi:hypothetical protein
LEDTSSKVEGNLKEICRGGPGLATSAENYSAKEEVEYKAYGD